MRKLSYGAQILEKFKLFTGAVQAKSDNDRRYLSIARAGMSALGTKSISTIAVIISVPLTLHHLGTERYGLWVTLYSIIAWFSLFDLGLSNGLLSALTEAYGKGRNDLAKSFISAAVQGLMLIAALAGIGCTLLALNTDWSSIFKIRDPAVAVDFNHAVVVAIVLFVLGLPLTVVGKIYIAYQRGEMANIWTAAATMGGLIGLAVAVSSGGDMLALVFGFAGGQFLVNAMSAAWLFGPAMPELRPSLRMGDHQYRRVFNTSAAMFATQLATLLYFQSPNLIISSRLGPEHVAPFQATWQLFFYITLPQMLVGANIWASIGEAYAKKDFGWIQKLFVRYVKLSALYGLTFIFVAVLFYEPIIMYWVGPAALADRATVYGMATWALLLALIQPVTSVVLGTGRIAVFAVFNLMSAICVVIVSYILTPLLGSVAIIGAFVVSLFMVIAFSWVTLIRPLMEGRNNA